jgi:hypothetical protein
LRTVFEFSSDFAFSSLSSSFRQAANPNDVAQGFVAHYFGQFDADRTQLGVLYVKRKKKKKKKKNRKKKKNHVRAYEIP